MIPTAASLAEWPKLIAHRVFVTPAMAQEWLDSGNIDNRSIRTSVVARYSVMMEKGEWKPTHQGVAFSDRRLIDGQHRLMALVKSGKPQWMIVFAEQADETYGVIDRGTSRQIRDDMPDLPNHWVDALSFLGQITAQGKLDRVPTPGYIRALREVFEPNIWRLNMGATTNKAKRTAAPIRAAVLVRHYIASAADAEYIEQQWRAWVSFDPEHMSRSISSLVRRFDNSGTNGRTAGYERAAIAWVGFDPSSRNLGKILLKDHNRTVDEIREIVTGLVPR